ncbi:MAG: hypothetical protein M1379_02520 [Firmicutes bacterium]|nr:hypothetical protein [Bacillota bacterium]
MAQVITRVRNRGLDVFLILITAHLVTLLGSAMSRFALGVYIYEQTGKVQDFATILVVGFIPGILLSPIAGVLVDRGGPRRMELRLPSRS